MTSTTFRTPEQHLRTANRVRLVVGFVAAVPVGAGALLVDAFAAFGLTPTCSSGPAVPSLLLTALLLAAAAFAVPSCIVGWSRPVLAGAAGALGAVAPFGVLVWFATTSQSGFCF